MIGAAGGLAGLYAAGLQQQQSISSQDPFRALREPRHDWQRQQAPQLGISNRGNRTAIEELQHEVDEWLKDTI